MKLNHINLPVSDVAAARDFLMLHFGLTTVMEIQDRMAILRDEGEMVLILSHFDKQPNEIVYHKDFHIGFYVETPAEVDAAHARLGTAGIPAAAPRKMQGRYSCSVPAPGGFEVEVACLAQSSWVRGESRAASPAVEASPATH